MNRALPAIVVLLFAAWIGAQFVSRAARPVRPAVPSPPAAPAGTVEVKVAPAPRREPPAAFAGRPDEVRGSLLTIDELELSGDVEGAVGKLEELLAGAPPREVKAASMIELARLHMVRRDFKAARALYEAFLKEFPGHAQQGNVERAIEFMASFETHRASFKPIEEELRR